MSSLPGPDTITEARLDNGLRLLIYENFASPTVIVDGYVPGGAVHEGPEQAGLATLTAGLLRRGSERRSFDAINEAVEAVGASFGFGSGRHVLSLDARCLPEHLPLVLDLMAESLIRPAFLPDQMEQLRGQRLIRIQEREHDTRALAWLSFRELIYGEGHPYATPLSGYQHTIAALSREDIISFYERCLDPAGGVVAIVGAIEAERAIELVAASLGRWQPAQAAAGSSAPPAPHLDGIRRVMKVLPEKSQSDFVLGWPGIPRQHDDYFPVLLCNSILGSFGMGGRIGHAVRERHGLAYYAYSSFSANLGAGTWSAAAGVNGAHIEQALGLVMAEVEGMIEAPVQDEELADVKANLSGSLPLRLETNAGIAGSLVTMAWYDLGLDYLRNYAAQVEGVGKEAIEAVARRYLDVEERYVLAVAGAGS